MSLVQAFSSDRPRSDPPDPPSLATRRSGRVRSTLALFAAALTLWTSAAKAEETHCSRVIRVAARPVGRFLWTNSDGQTVGPVRDLLDLVGPRVGCLFQYDQLSTARVTALFGDGDIDILPGAKTPARDVEGRFVLLVSDRLVLLSQTDRHLAVSSAADLLATGVTVDVVHGYDFGAPYLKLLTALAQNGRLVENVSLKTLAERMADGRSEAALMTAPPFVDAALAAGLRNRLQVTPLDGLPPVIGGLYLVERALGKADSDLLDRAISDGVRRGEFLEFFSRSVAGVPWGMTGVLPDTELPRQ